MLNSTHRTSFRAKTQAYPAIWSTTHSWLSLRRHTLCNIVAAAVRLYAVAYPRRPWRLWPQGYLRGGLLNSRKHGMCWCWLTLLPASIRIYIPFEGEGCLERYAEMVVQRSTRMCSPDVDSAVLIM